MRTERIHWGGYVPVGHLVLQPEELPRKVARQKFHSWMAERDERLEQLSKLMSINGIHLDTSVRKIQLLNDWYVHNVELKFPRARTDKWVLESVWYSVANDIVVFLGEAIFERQPELGWYFFTPRSTRASGYQNHVISGYVNVDGVVDRSFYYNIADVVVSVGHTAAFGERQSVCRSFISIIERSQEISVRAKHPIPG